MANGNIIALRLLGERPPHRIAETVAIFARSLVAKFQINFRFRLAGFFHALMNIINHTFVPVGNFFGARFLSGNFAKDAGRFQMQWQLFLVVIENNDRNARFFQRLQIILNHLPLPVTDDNQIRFQRKDFFHGKSACFHFANIGQLFQFRQCLAIDFPTGRGPVRPYRLGKADDIVERFLATNGKIIGVIKTEHDALGGHINFDFASEDVLDGFDFRVGGGHGSGHHGGGEQFFQHKSS